VTPANFFGVDVGRSFDVALPLCAQPITAERSYLERRNYWWLSSFWTSQTRMDGATRNCGIESGFAIDL
jgi:hypothetical protein